MSHEIVSLKNVWVDFDGVTVLRDHTFSIRQNDFLGIIGPNGGGKTTLLKVILGLVRPSHGSVEVFGRDPERVRKRTGYVPQITSFARDFPISVWDVVLMGRLSRRALLRRFTAEDRASAADALKTVEMLDGKDRQIGTLSDGERQRVFIARALVSQPELLLLDEPTASVDPKIKMGIYKLLGNLKKNMAIILVTHDMGVIASYVDKIACLNCQLFYHNSKEISQEELEAVYHCPVDIIAHGIPHRVLKKHHNGKEEC